MYAVDNPSAVDAMPAVAPVMSTAPKWFTEGASNQKPTYPGPDWFNIVQAELLNLLSAAKITPDKSDNTQLSQAITEIIKTSVTAATNSLMPAVGSVQLFIKNVNPNAQYEGTVWTLLGPGLTLRTGKADGTDAGTFTGSDSVTLGVNNLPSHSHSIGGNTGGADAVSTRTDIFDYGTKPTNTTGQHQHNYTDDPTTDAGTVGSGGYVYPLSTRTAATTSGAGDHSHTVGIGGHDHAVTLPAHSHSLPANTGNTGAAAGISVVSSSILLMAWQRIS